MAFKVFATSVLLMLAPISASAADGDTTIDYSTADAAMNAAQDEARSHLDAFYANVLNQNGIATRAAGVKVAFPIGGNNVEVAWVTPFGIRDGQGVGVLANQPRDIEGVNAGDRVEFTADQVRDWYVFGEDGKMYGSYTTRVMLDDLSEAEAAQIAELLSDEPIPADW